MAQLAERFAEAVRTLVGDGTVKQRLSRAYAECLKGLDPADLPTSLRGTFGDLEAALTRVPAVGNKTRVHATVQKMSPREAGSHAGTILKLYVELVTGAEQRAEPLKIVTSSKKPPRYLTKRT
jgi:hypothetical protein